MITDDRTLAAGGALAHQWSNKTMFTADAGNSATVVVMNADGGVISQLDSGDTFTDPADGYLDELYTVTIPAGCSLHVRRYLA
jgi:hypothetical protein